MKNTSLIVPEKSHL